MTPALALAPKYNINTYYTKYFSYPGVLSNPGVKDLLVTGPLSTASARYSRMGAILTLGS